MKYLVRLVVIGFILVVVSCVYTIKIGQYGNRVGGSVVHAEQLVRLIPEQYDYNKMKQGTLRVRTVGLRDFYFQFYGPGEDLDKVFANLDYHNMFNSHYISFQFTMDEIEKGIRPILERQDTFQIWVDPIAFVNWIEGYGRIRLHPEQKDVYRLLREEAGTLCLGIQLGEWGYHYHNSVETGVPRPKDRMQAYQQMEEMFNDVKSNLGDHILSTTGHSYYVHYAAKWGADIIGVEIGEHITSTATHMAFTRGASRQYDVPWTSQISPWFHKGYTNYQPSDSPESYSLKGHSESFINRHWYYSYMSGAALVCAEASGENFFLKVLDAEKGVMELSRLGLMGKKFNDLTQNGSFDRGIPYTLVALLMSQYSGFATTPSGGTWSIRPWWTFSPSHRDEMAYQFFEQVYPNSFFDNQQEISGYLTTSPYGDIFDVLLSDVSLDVLQDYPVVILLGEFDADSSFAQRLDDYVKQGGVLVLHQTYVKDLGDLGSGIAAMVSHANRNTVGVFGFGQGSIITVNQYNRQIPQIPDSLLRSLSEDLLPLRIDGDIFYLINRNANGWILTLINNDGFVKQPLSFPRKDERAKKTVHITYLGEVSGVREWILGEDIEWLVNGDHTEFSITVSPGELVIIEIAVCDQ